MSTVILKAKSLFKNKQLIRYAVAVVLLATVCILALTLKPKGPVKSIEMYGLSVLMPKGAERAEVLDGGGRALLYKGDTVVGGVKFLRYSLKDTDGITIEADAKQVGRRKYTQEEEMHVVQVCFERPYPKDSGKTGNYIEKHVCLVPSGGDYVYDFYEVEKAARSGTVEFMRKNWVTVETAPRPGEGWTELPVNLAALREEQALLDTGTETEHKNLMIVSDNVISALLGKKNDKEHLYYQTVGSDSQGFSTADGARNYFADIYYMTSDDRCIAVRMVQPVKTGQNGAYAAVGWREYQPEDLPPMEELKRSAGKESFAYNLRKIKTYEQGGTIYSTTDTTTTYHAELLDAFSEAMFRGEAATVDVASFSLYTDGKEYGPFRWQRIVFDGTKAVRYYCFKQSNGKYYCYLPMEFTQLDYEKVNEDVSYYTIRTTDTVMPMRLLLDAYEVK